jgi:hypothetical protein
VAVVPKSGFQVRALDRGRFARRPRFMVVRRIGGVRGAKRPQQQKRGQSYATRLTSQSHGRHQGNSFAGSRCTPIFSEYPVTHTLARLAGFVFHCDLLRSDFDSKRGAPPMLDNFFRV